MKKLPRKKNNSNIKVNLKVAASEFEMVSDDVRLFYNKKTGEFDFYTDFSDAPFENRNLKRFSDKAWVACPDHFAIHEYNIMVDFAETITDPRKNELLSTALRGTGAFRRFKDTLHHIDLVDEWYKFRQRALIEIAKEWCDVHGLEYDELPQSDAELIHKVNDSKIRRKDKEITNINEMLEIIEKCKHCRLGLSENNLPYIVPLSYGYSYENEKLTLYFHGAKEGKKLDVIQKNNNACFEIDCDVQLVEGKVPSKYGYEYKSIIGFGKIILLETNDEKTVALNYLMKHQTGKDVKYDYSESDLNSVVVFKIVIDEFTGKRSPVL